MSGWWEYIVCWADRGMRRFRHISYEVEHEMGAALGDLPAVQDDNLVRAIAWFGNRCASTSSG